MATNKDFIPVIGICAQCQHLSFGFIEVLGDDGRTQDYQAYWACGILNGGALFFDDTHNASGCGGHIQLETALPLDCPYTLEQALFQDMAGREKWPDLLPLLKKKV